MRQSHDVQAISRDLLLKTAPGPARWQRWPERHSPATGRRGDDSGSVSGRAPDGAFGSLRRRHPSSRRDALLGLGQFYLMSIVYGAAVYGFIVGYLLVLGAITEPAPVWPTP